MQISITHRITAPPAIPAWLTYLSDAIIKYLPIDESTLWLASYLEALTPDTDFERLRHGIAARRLGRLIALQDAAVAKPSPEPIHEFTLHTRYALCGMYRYHVAILCSGLCRDWADIVAPVDTLILIVPEPLLSSLTSGRESAWDGQMESAMHACAAFAWDPKSEHAEDAPWRSRWRAAWHQEATALLDLMREAVCA